MTTATMSGRGLEKMVRRLQERIAELEARLDALAGANTKATPTPHSTETLAWAKEHGIDLDEFVPYQPGPVGTYTMTVNQAAMELGLGVEQVRRYLRDTRLRGMALGGRAGWRVSRADVARFKETRTAIGL